MDDEMEDRILLKLLSKGIPLNAAPFSYGWRMLRSYVLKPEILIFGVLLFVVYLYLQTLDIWSRGLFSKLQFSLDKPKSIRLFGISVLEDERLSWELKENTVAAYAVQGRRSKMEDRFVIVEDINDSGISLFAVFDGHGGEFAANYARDHLIKNINTKLMEVKNLQMESAKGEFNSSYTKEESDKKTKEDMNKKSEKEQERKASFKKTSSVTDECVKREGASAGVTDPDLLKMLDSLQRPITREVRYRMPEKITKIPLTSYLDSSKFSGINYGKIISDEVVATDRLLVEAAKKTMDVAGTTALIALLEGDHLVVANVGDSRGVMCDSKGNAIPLSFDHKPQQIKERKRIREAGGFISFNGVWRVAGILATSRALGDYPLKDKNLVIPDPDILTFNLTDHKPLFMLLASDGLWDTFSNEEAVAFIKERLNEPHYGAKSITLQAYFRGSLDNITVMVINFKDMKWSSYNAKKNA